MSPSRGLALMGQTKRPREMRPPAEMRLTATLEGAIDLALIRKGWTHQTLADELGCTRAAVTMMQSGKRRWPAQQVVKVCIATGDMAPMQFLVAQVGGVMSVNELERERAALKARLAALNDQESA